MKQRILILFLILLCGFAIADGEIHVPYWSGSTLYLVRFQSNGDAFLSDGLSDEVWGTGGRDADDYDIPLAESGASGHYVGNFDTLTNIGAGEYHFNIFVQVGGSPADSDQPAGFWGSIVWTGTAEDRRAVVGDVTAAHSATDTKIDTTDALITSSHSATDAKIDTTDALITSSHSATDAKIDTTDALITSSHSATDAKIDTTDALITSSHSATDALIASSHSATDAKIDTVDANVDAIKAVTDLLPDGGALTSLATLANQTWLINFSEADTFTDTDTTPWREIIRLKGTTTPITEKELFGTEGEDIVAKTQRIGQIKEPD